jgi:hypothetical protein
MTFDINTITSLTGVTGAGRVTTSAADRLSMGATDQHAVELDVLPSSPPPELYDQFQVASDAYDRLAARGLQIQFNTRDGGGLNVNLRDSSGTEVKTLTASQALAVAAGWA